MKKLLDVKIKFDELDIGLKNLLRFIRPTWQPEVIKHKVISGGTTNQLAVAYLDEKDDDKIIIRINGIGTEVMIDRKAEIENMLKLSEAGIGAKVYCQFSNGLAYEFLEGKTFDDNLIGDPQVYRLITKHMAEIHSIQIPPDSKSIILPKICDLLALVPTSFADKEKDKLFKEKYPSVKALNEEMLFIKEFLESCKSSIVFSHNDCMLRNVIYNKETDKVNFIDFEYSGPNYQAFDIANHFSEFAGPNFLDTDLIPDKDFQYIWIRKYLEAWNKIHSPGKLVTETDIHELYLLVDDMSMVPNFFWSLWALIQASNSCIEFDFFSYAFARMKEYFKVKNKALKRRQSDNIIYNKSV